MNTLLVITRNPDIFGKKLAERNLPNLEIILGTDDEIIQQHISQASIILADPPLAAKWINQAKNLKWFQSTFAGIDSLITPDLPQDYLLTNVKDTYGQVMAEYVLGYILMFEREMHSFIQEQPEKAWRQRPFTCVEGKTVGIMGTGSIGKEIARSLSFFNMKTIGLKHTQIDSLPYFDNIYTFADIHTFLEQCDYVISVLPSTKETDNMINATTLKHMKSEAVFMNIGRGNAVDEDALYQVLQTKQIKAAVLDVFKQEPLPETHPFWTAENAYITPHVSGYYINEKIFEIFEENYQRFVNDEPLQYQVDFKKGY